MASAYDDVLSLVPGKESWRILVKVIRLWYGQSFGNGRLPSSLELVVMDGKGCKIHVFIKRTLMYKFERILSDGQVFLISCFEVVENSGQFKPTKHEFKVNLMLKSDVRPMNQYPITADPFDFIPLSDVIAPDFDTSFLIDVIGTLSGYGTEREIVTNGKKVMMNVIEIESAGIKVECALFGTYNEQLNIWLRNGEMFNVVMILQRVKVNIFQGSITLQNVHGATKLMFNPAMALSDSVKKRSSEMSSSGSQSLSQLQDSSKANGADEFLLLTPRKTIADLNEFQEDACFVIGATVSFVEQGHDWWYTACKCNKKVFPDEKMYFCEGCNRHVVTVFPRYRLQLMVYDDTASASILLFDKEATVLIGKPCAELVEMAETTNGIPPDLAALYEKKNLFKVEVKHFGSSKFDTCKYGPSYKVKKVCCDPQVIDQYSAALLDNSVGVTSSRIMATPSNVLQSVQVTKDLLDEFVVVSSEKTPSTPDFVTIDLNDNTQDVLFSERSTSPETDGVVLSNLKKKKIPAKLKKEK